MYEPTPAGRAALASWLRAPVEPATVSRDLGLHLMRFVMMERLFPPEEVLTFLGSLHHALAVFTSELEGYTAATDLSGRHSRLALDHGLAVHRASLRWVEHAITALSAAHAPSPIAGFVLVGPFIVTRAVAMEIWGTVPSSSAKWWPLNPL